MTDVHIVSIKESGGGGGEQLHAQACVSGERVWVGEERRGSRGVLH